MVCGVCEFARKMCENARCLVCCDISISYYTTIYILARFL